MLKRLMTYAEFVEQIVYYRLEPWGDDWAQAGIMAHASASPHSKRRLKPEDFMPKAKKISRSKRQAPLQMAAMLNMLAQQCPKEVKRG